MTSLLTFLDWVGRFTAVLFLISVIAVLWAWLRGILAILPPLIRLGNGLAKRRIAIFAKADHLASLKILLQASKLFNKKNVIEISSVGDFGQAEQATLFLVYWRDWSSDQITKILSVKKNNTALIVYFPHEGPVRISDDKMQQLNEESNVTVANMRGRLLNDILISLMTSSYQ